jgi:antitoxin CptB
LRAAPPGELIWRCRRGTKELDVLLERYVKHAYADASDAERGCFRQILELPDPVLTDYFFGHVLANDPVVAGLVERIRTYRD